MIVAFQGERGAYSEQAARAYFADSIEVLPCNSFNDITAAISQGAADHAFLPLENSTAGSVLPAYDALLNCNLNIVGDWAHPVHHCLLGLKEAELFDIKVALSHPQGLAQSAGFIQDHSIEAEAFYDTAGSAKFISQNTDKTRAAIASELCAEIYDLKILARNIEDLDDNQTRFVVLSKDKNPIKQPDDSLKTSMIFSLNNEPGALVHALNIFADAGMDLAKIESRPDRIKPFCYQFILDFKHHADQPISNVVDQLNNLTTELRVLGTW